MKPIKVHMVDADTKEVSLNEIYFSLGQRLTPASVDALRELFPIVEQGKKYSIGNDGIEYFSIYYPDDLDFFSQFYWIHEVDTPHTLNQVNRENRGGKFYGAYLKKQETEKQWKIAINRNPPSFKGKVWMNFHWYYTRDCDPCDNLPVSLKPILDALVAAKVILDDSTKVIQSPFINSFERGEKNTVKIMISNFNPITGTKEKFSILP